jgi:hypothetical protein
MMQCTHLNQMREVTPSADGCEDCLEIADGWVHLRLRMTCGHVGCCDDSNPGSVRIPPAHLPGRHQEVPRDQELALFCT